MIIHNIKFGSKEKEIDDLAEKVLKGEKTATSSLLDYYTLGLKQLSQIGDLAYILNSRDEKLAIVKIEKIEIIRFKDITDAFAKEEGDGNFENWFNIHHSYYSQQLAKIGKQLTDDTELVCEWFTIQKILI